MASGLYALTICCDAQSWDAFFRNVSNDAAPGLAHVPASCDHGTTPEAAKQVSLVASTSDVPSKVIDDHLALQAIVRAYQV